jgi:NADPH-dependent curcumin reductase CurA
MSQAAGLSRLVFVSTTNGDVMKIFTARASGAIGAHLIPLIVVGGHQAVGTTSSAAKTGALRHLEDGVTP